MKRKTQNQLSWLGAALITAALQLTCVAALQAQDDDVMRRVLDLTLPGPEHAIIERLAGSWDVELRTWSEAGSPPLLTTGTAEHVMVLEGRFLDMRLACGEGELFSASNMMLGFDRRTEEYHLLVFDTWGTHYLVVKGHFSTDQSSFIFTGSDFDPKQDLIVKYVVRLRLIGENNAVLQMAVEDFPHVREKEFTIIEQRYTRRSGTSR